MGNNGCGPCGACKYLRRKCVKNCVFAPYFDSDTGTAHFTAVHRVFGAGNASKLLLRVPPHRRLDAVVSLCYEALSRVRDPVHGCMAEIFTLQQQVDNLQTELSYIRTQISILQHLHDQPSLLPNIDVLWSPANVSSSTISTDKMSFATPICPYDDTSRSREQEGGDLEMLAREFLANYVPRVDE